MDHYQDYLSILARAKTFETLLFYNRQIVNPYLIAAYGFKRVIPNNVDKQNQSAKCQFCRCCIIFDPLENTQISEPKEPLRYALKNHQEECQYYMTRQKSEIFTINKKTTLQYGHRLYKQIFSSYLSIEENKIRIKPIDQHSFALITTKDKEFIEYFCAQKKISRKIHYLCLLGWQFNSNADQNFLLCKYCGSQQKLSQGEYNDQFDFFESHNASCVMNKQKLWAVIQNKITLEKLKNSKTQFLKTEAMIQAKQIQNQINEYFNQKSQIFRTFQKRLNTLKESRLKMIEKNQEVSSNETIQVLDRLSSFSKVTQEYFRQSIKKIKKQ